MPETNIIELLSTCAIRAPGGMDPEGQSIQVILKQHAETQRLAFEFHTPQKISRNSYLQFDIDYSHVQDLKYEISRGDPCLPEFILESVSGECFRFKRGNFKDFFSMSGKDHEQRIRLPIGSFVYHNDMRSNAPESGTFFNDPVRQISVDFLKPDIGEANVFLMSPKLVPADPKLDSVFSYLDFFPCGSAADSELFVTRGANLSLRVTKSEFSESRLPVACELQIVVRQFSERFEMSTAIENGENIIKLPIDFFGQAEISMLLTHMGEEIAKSEVTGVRCFPSRGKICDSIGLSDGANLYRAGLQGGNKLRTIINLNQIRETEGGFHFQPNLDPFQSFKRLNVDWLVSFKSMPKFLQQDPANGFRKGPADLDKFRSLMEWLLKELDNAGVKFVESWNEANVLFEWSDTFENLEEMHSALHEVIVENQLEIKLLTPSSSTWDFGFFEEVCNSSIIENSAGLAMHGYTYAPQNANHYFEELDRILKNGRYPDVPVFMTEIGFRTPAFSLNDQAEYLSLFTLHAAFRDRINCTIWFRFQNSKPENFSSYDQNASSRDTEWSDIGVTMLAQRWPRTTSCLRFFRC